MQLLQPESRTFADFADLPVRETVTTVPVPDDEDSIFAIDCEPFLL